MQHPLLLAATCLMIPFTLLARGEDVLFSGPQVGEPLLAFSVRGVFDDDAGKELDFVTGAQGQPIVLIFVHDVNRQSIGMTRTLSQYTSSRSGDHLHTGVVWLRDDATEAESELKRIRHALAPSAPIGISLDGREGPGSYGLNRNVMLTILVGKDNKVTANYALVQPSLQVDLPRILDSVIDLVGGKKPELEELTGMPAMTPRPGNKDSTPNMRPLLQPLIARSASVDEVDQAARAIEKAMAEDKDIRRELGRITNTIIDAGKLSNYGTEHAQHYLSKWAKEIGKPVDDSLDSSDNTRDRN